MHAVIVRVSISDPDGSVGVLRERVVPGVSKAPGFVTGYWTRKGNTGLSMVIFESAEAAESMGEQVRSILPEGVTLEEVEVREVVAHA